MQKLTIIESPFRGDLVRNMAYLSRAIRHSISLGEIPFASHGLYTRFLTDENPEERHLGITLGYNFYHFSRLIVFYNDYGMSEGMDLALEHVSEMFPNKRVTWRLIGTNERPK